MTHKSDARKAAGRKSFSSNPTLKLWAQASSIAYKDYTEGKVEGIQPGLLLCDLMKVEEYKRHRAEIKKKLENKLD